MKKELRRELREIYQKIMPKIISAHPRIIDPYFVDWLTIFTPIEKNVWHDIRILGLPLYPQFPVKGYFIDFADPVLKIGVEVDGKQWHQDKAKDDAREDLLHVLGWQIIRINGSQTFDDYDSTLREADEMGLREDDPLEYEKCVEKYENCSEGILKKLAIEFYGRS